MFKESLFDEVYKPHRWHLSVWLSQENLRLDIRTEAERLGLTTDNAFLEKLDLWEFEISPPFGPACVATHHDENTNQLSTITAFFDFDRISLLLGRQSYQTNNPEVAADYIRAGVEMIYLHERRHIIQKIIPEFKERKYEDIRKMYSSLTKLNMGFKIVQIIIASQVIGLFDQNEPIPTTIIKMAMIEMIRKQALVYVKNYNLWNSTGEADARQHQSDPIHYNPFFIELER